MDGGSAKIASLHGCNLLAQRTMDVGGRVTQEAKAKEQFSASSFP